MEILEDINKKADHNKPDKMNYDLVLQIIDLLNDFDQACKADAKFPQSKSGFVAWVAENYLDEKKVKKKKIVEK